MSTTIQPATMKGPAIFLAQFAGAEPPFDSFDAICGWAAGWHPRCAIDYDPSHFVLQ